MVISLELFIDQHCGVSPKCKVHKKVFVEAYNKYFSDNLLTLYKAVDPMKSFKKIIEPPKSYTPLIDSIIVTSSSSALVDPFVFFKK